MKHISELDPTIGLPSHVRTRIQCEAAWYVSRVNEIMDRVGSVYGVSRAEIVGRQKTASLAEARQLVYALCRRVMGMTFFEIGVHLDRDHSTVINGCQVVMRRIKDDSELQAIVCSHFPELLQEREVSK